MRVERLGCLLAALVGCTTPKTAAPPPPETAVARSVTPTFLDYVDADGFDALLENAFVNQDPAVIVRTGRGQPDWGDRLNAWVAAWNLAGHTQNGERVRMQAAPFAPPVAVNGESIREFRLLVEALWGRIDERSRQGLAWLSEEKTRARRLRLLKPYNLRFHKDGDGPIELVFFHGRYAEQYREFVASYAASECDGWERSCSCSTCATPKKKAPIQLTSGEEPPR